MGGGGGGGEWERGRGSIDGVGRLGDGDGGEERRIEIKGKREGGWMCGWSRAEGEGGEGEREEERVWMEWSRRSGKEGGRESREESGRGNGREDECVDKVEERVGRSDKISDIRIPT